MRQVSADVEAVTQRMFERIVATVPEYVSVEDPAVVAADLRDNCRAQVLNFLGSVGARPAAVLELGFSEDTIIRRVRQGIPVQAMLHAFRIGHDVLWEAMIAEARQLEGGEAGALLLVQPSIQYIDTLSTLIADTYVRENQRAIAESTRIQRDVLELLLSGDPEASELARAAGINISAHQSYVVAVGAVRAANPAAALQIVAEEVGKSFSTDALLVVIRQNTVTAILAGEPQLCRVRIGEVMRKAGERTTARLHLGVGLPIHDIQLSGTAFRQALRARELASDGTPLVWLGDLPVTDYVVATADDVAVSLIPEAVRDLVSGGSAGDDELLATLWAYLRSGLNVQQAAATMPAHPNTVHARLRRLSSRTGTDLRNVEDLFELALGVRILESPCQAEPR